MERTEHRWTSGGDYFKLVFDEKGQITKVNVTRKKIGRKMSQNFELDIEAEFKKSKYKVDKQMA
ncbi:hypothetical protein D3C78_1294370 [compost metagenome]